MEVDPDQMERVLHVRRWITERARDIRTARGFSQAQLGDKMGIGKSRVCDFEKDVNDYKVSTVLRAAYAMGVTMEQFFRGCPGWTKRKARKASEPSMVIASEEKLRKVLSDAGLSKASIDGVVSELSEPV